MEPWVIVAFTLIVIGLILFVIWGSFWLLDSLNDYFNDSGTSNGMKALLLVPFIILWLWCIILSMFTTIIAIFTGYQIAMEFRNWWHKGS